MQYRPEIDGLRAIAILPVLLFHAGLLSGGYLGVDIFFVISGYLITGIILSDLTKNQFSFAKFYERRARRILPMLLLICIFSVPFATSLMPSKQLLEFAQSVIAVELFVSNFWFWQKINYFSSDVNLLPLIHTWSLAVEEQFYLFYPPIILGIWRFARKHAVKILLLIGFGSLIIAQYLSTQDAAANFYLLPSRAWELTTGALLAYLELNGRPKINLVLNRIINIIAFFIICYCLILFTDTSPQPSLITLIPISATAVLIRYSGGMDLVSRILTHKLLVGIGLISYSMYLWHQPILAYSRLQNFGMLAESVKYTFIPVTVFCAYITWRFIEKPFRNKQLMNLKNLILWLSILSLVLFTLSLSIIIAQKFAKFSKIPENVQATISFSQKNIFCSPEDVEAKESYCLVGNTSKPEADFIAFGDSHAQSALIGLNAAAIKHNQYGIVFHLNSCNPIMDLNLTPDSSAQCTNRNASVYEYVKQHQVKTVIFISRWSFLFTYIQKFRAVLQPKANTEENIQRAHNNFAQTIKKYQALGVKTIFMQQVPEQQRDPKLVYAAIYDLQPEYRQGALVAYSLPAINNQQMQQDFLAFLAPHINDMVTILNPSPQFCSTDVCLFGTLNASYYRNIDHVSTIGSARLESIFTKILASNS